MSESLRFRPLSRLAVLGIGSLSLVGCSVSLDADNSPATEWEQRFMDESDAVVLSRGQMGRVPVLDRDLRDEYKKLRFVSSKDKEFLGDEKNRDNVLALKPNRYETTFDRGKDDDGDQPDSICEDIRVTEDTKYVLAVQDDNKDVWLSFEPDGSEVHLCYNSTGDRPKDVAVWGSNESR